jgi:hypothetical protein
MKDFFDSAFYSNLTAIIGYLRRQYTFIAELKAKCPTVATTRWLSLGAVCEWFCTHRVQIIAYFDSKNPNRPACAPTMQWWISTAMLARLMKDVNSVFTANQGLKTLVQEQVESLAKLKNNLVQMSGAIVLPIVALDNNATGSDNSQNLAFVTRGQYQINKDDAIKMIQDCGSFFEDALNLLSENAFNSVWMNAAKLVLTIITGIDEVEMQNATSSGTPLPPVLPFHLVKLRNREFNAILREQKDRLTAERAELIEEQHRQLLLTYRDNELIHQAIDMTKQTNLFHESWKCINTVQFAELKEFCGGLATVFPTTATVESDFSNVNREKDKYRAALTDFSLEGRLHAKQHKLVQSLK